MVSSVVSGKTSYPQGKTNKHTLWNSTLPRQRCVTSVSAVILNYVKVCCMFLLDLFN